MKIIHDMYEYAEKISMRLGKEDVELTTDEDVIAFIVSNEKEYIRMKTMDYLIEKGRIICQKIK